MSCDNNQTKQILDALKSLIDDVKVTPYPKELFGNPDFVHIYNTLNEVRSCFLDLSSGKLDYPITSKGYLTGTMKSLQANLKHLIWQTKALASGEFNQTVDFLGEFSEAFNLMSNKLSSALSESMKKERKSREAMEYFQLIFNTSPDGAFVASLSDNKIVNANISFFEITGYSEAEVLGKTSLDLDLYVDKNDRQKTLNELFLTNVIRNKELFLKRKSGEIAYALISAKTIDFYGKPSYLGVIRDITELKTVQDALKASEERYRLLTEYVSDVIWVYNLSHRKFTYISPSVFSLRGLTTEEAMAEKWSDSILEDSCPLYREQMRNNLNAFLQNPHSPQNYIIEAQQYTKSGKAVWVEFATKYRYNENKEIEIVGVSRNIEERKIIQEKILYLTYHDQLTGLYNRRYYEKELLNLSNKANYPLTLILGDVNYLKDVNDNLGHLKGDELLQRVADILCEVCRKNDIAARLGGDEFILLLPNTLPEQAEQMILKMKGLCKGQKIGNYDLSIAFGCDTVYDEKDNLQTAFIKAEDKMYLQKRSER